MGSHKETTTQHDTHVFRLLPRRTCILDRNSEDERCTRFAVETPQVNVQHQHCWDALRRVLRLRLRRTPCHCKRRTPARRRRHASFKVHCLPCGRTCLDQLEGRVVRESSVEQSVCCACVSAEASLFEELYRERMAKQRARSCGAWFWCPAKGILHACRYVSET